MTTGSGGLRHRKQAGSQEKKEVPSLKQEEDEASVTAKRGDHSSDSDADHDPFVLTPLARRSIAGRLDTGPFFLAYAALIAADVGYPEARPWITVLFAVTLLGQLSLVLACQWSVSVQAKVGFQKQAMSEQGMSQWTHCLVQNLQSSPSTASLAGIVPVHLDDKDLAVVSFHDRIFRCAVRQPDLDVTLWKSTKENTGQPMRFRPLRYPIDLPLSFYASWKGHTSLPSVVTASQVYGVNATLLQLPTFLELLSEQLVAPFFLFQIFCVVLWSLDEYWYYAIFTLVALIIFESTVAYNRLTGLQRLHTAGHKGTQRVWVHRGNWVTIATRELVPGDRISLVTGTQPTQVPADILLMSGTAVADEALLTGESVPQLKQGLDVSSSGNNGGADALLDMQQHKESILFGGTVLLMTNASTEEDTKDTPPPDKGIVGTVLRTGFETAQGSLLRTMAHSSKSADGIHTWDTFVFILLLLFCAVAAAGWVLQTGWNDERRNRFRLVLHVIIIITSVVPPELPMELSLAVTNSVADLMKRCRVYCTELFRIPWAGEVDICCFDKTGTLTSDEMILRGVRLFSDKGSSPEHNNEDDALLHPLNDTLPWSTLRVMAGCHSLALAGKVRKNRLPPIIGDPLEQAVLENTGYHLSAGNAVTLNDEDQQGDKAKSILILHRFAFASRLKRMTVLGTEEGGKGKIVALTKGAPETIKDLCTKESIPDNYDDVSHHHMSRGRRVLALAYREIGYSGDLARLQKEGRDAIETSLTFAGFLVLECPLKPDSKTVITELRKSGHGVVMITGDAILTAAEVARQVGIIPSSSDEHVTYKIQAISGDTTPSRSPDILSNFECVSLGAKAQDLKTFPLSHSALQSLLQKSYDGTASFCISGDVLTKIALAAAPVKSTSLRPARLSIADESHVLLHPYTQSVLTQLVPLVSVFARHAPHQKEAVVAAFNHGSHRTLMCGDGTNDVGALKRAHVGISIVSAPEVESKQREASATLSRLKSEKKREKKAKKSGKKAQSRHHAASMDEYLRQLREAQEELDHVELGDASVAAPFTSRAVSIKCCKDVIQQGRCTLVTMLTIYKILGCNCLVNALVLSKLFLHGVKQGDRQLTILGIAVAGLFYFVTRAEPLSTLSAVRPPSSVLCLQALLSITLQFLLHLVAVLLATEAALSFVDPYDPSMIPDGPFNPNVLNTCTFLLTCLTTINTFAVNYRGRPFMADLRENKLLYRSIQICYAVLLIAVFEVFPPLNDLMQLSELPRSSESGVEDFSVGPSSMLTTLVRTVDFPVFLCGLMAADTALAFALESIILRYL